MTVGRWLAATFAAALTLPAHAELAIGSKAPDFTTEAVLGDKVYAFTLSVALNYGPVVLYFYPAAFTPGCTIEAHDFAEAVDKFRALGAMVIGVSHDTIDTLKRFSQSECRGMFPVASDRNQHIMKAYDAVLLGRSPFAKRTSYVIAPDGMIIYRYTAMNPDKHVEHTLSAVKSWVGSHVH